MREINQVNMYLSSKSAINEENVKENSSSDCEIDKIHEECFTEIQ